MCFNLFMRVFSTAPEPMFNVAKDFRMIRRSLADGREFSHNQLRAPNTRRPLLLPFTAENRRNNSLARIGQAVANHERFKTSSQFQLATEFYPTEQGKSVFRAARLWHPEGQFFAFGVDCLPTEIITLPTEGIEISDELITLRTAESLSADTDGLTNDDTTNHRTNAIGLILCELASTNPDTGISVATIDPNIVYLFHPDSLHKSPANNLAELVTRLSVKGTVHRA